MTQYLLSVHHDGSDQYTDEEMQTVFAEVDAFNNKLQADGSWVFGGGLHPIDASTTVDARGDEVMVTDGPYAETKEYLGGFWVVEAPDLDAALTIAESGSKACRQAIEVRPLQSE